MTTNDDTRVEVRRMARLLKGIAEMAEGASLSGSLSGGVASAARRYNAIVQRLEALGVITSELFQPLQEGVSFDEVGVESGLLARYLKDYDQDEVRSDGKSSGLSNNSVVVSLGGLKELKDLNDLRDLGKVIREQLPGWLRVQARGDIGTVEVRSESGPSSLSEVESRLAEVGSKLQMVAEQLRRTDLSDALRSEMAEQLSRLAQEQADLSRKHADLRERQ